MSEVLDLTCDLISRPSVTPDDAGCQMLLAGRLQRAGFACEHLRFGAVENLWATHGSGAPVLVLLGHTDVVPPGPREAWTSDPFVPQVRDGVLYGRGAADMKGSVAAFVVAAERFVAAHPAHAGTLAILLTADEEGDAIDGVRQVAQAFRERGQRIDWCVTGDQFRVDADGRYWYEGRTDDMLKVSGIFVSPLEIEDCLLQHPGVAEVCVVGRPDAGGLVKPLAIVVVRPPAAPAETLARELRDLAKARLAPYKYPRWIRFVETLPRNDRGKVERKRIRDGHTLVDVAPTVDLSAGSERG